MEKTKKIFLAAIAFLVILGALILLNLFTRFGALFTAETTMRENMFGVIGIFGIIVFGGIYLMNTGEKILRGIF
jgi:hypothetical protein